MLKYHSVYRPMFLMLSSVAPSVQFTAVLKRWLAYFQRTRQSLIKLGFEEEAEALSRVAFDPSRKSVSLRELFIETSRPVLEGIARRNNFKVDIDEYLRRLLSPRKTLRSPVHLARNFYIYDKVSYLFLSIISFEGLFASVRNLSFKSNWNMFSFNPKKAEIVTENCLYSSEDLSLQWASEALLILVLLHQWSSRCRSKICCNTLIH